MAEQHPWGPLRFRLALWNTLVVLGVTLTALFAARYAARATLYDATDRELRGGVTEVVLALEDLFPDMDAVVAAMKRKAASQEKRGWFSMLLSGDGTVIWKSAYCPEAVAALPPRDLDKPEVSRQVGPFRYVRHMIAQPGLPVFLVRVGTYTTGLDESLSGLMRWLTFVGSALCSLTPLVGWWLAAWATRPVAAILQTADRLDPARLADRLPVRGTHDELDHLATTINGLLDDVAENVSRQEEFVADAAHELRGPLAAIQGAIESTLAHERNPDEYREALELTLAESRELSKLSNGLLMLAEAGPAGRPAPTQPVDVAGLVRQAVAMFAAVGEDKDLDVRCAGVDREAVVAGDATQLRQVIGNLLDNAIRFTPAGGTVEVAVAPGDPPGSVTLTVADTGTGIATEHLPRLFDRFYKVDPARCRGRGESRSGGLGLPICKAIVERHGGRITVANRPGGGTQVVVTLPEHHATEKSTPSRLGPAPPRGEHPRLLAAASQHATSGDLGALGQH